MRKISYATLALGLIPFAGMCFSVSLWDRVEPTVAGLPFNMFWLILWILLSSGCMWVANRVEAGRASRQPPKGHKGRTPK